METQGSLPCLKEPPIPRPCVTSWLLCGENLLDPRPTPKMEAHILSVVHDWLFNLFAVTLHICRPSPLSTTRGRATGFWQGPA